MNNIIEKENPMNIYQIQVGSLIIYTSDRTFIPINMDQMRLTKLDDLPQESEVVPFDSITENQFKLLGLRVSIIRLSENRFVIGCVECPEYQEFRLISNEDLQKISCYEFLENFLVLIGYKLVA